MRAALLALLAAPALALEVPSGALPEIDGRVEDKEWASAARREAGPAVARFLLAGRALCIGLTVEMPYEGERIDFQVADSTGADYVWHAFHPGCYLPAYPFFPVAPVVVRRASWTTREMVEPVPPRNVLFRARVYREGHRWSAEVAIDIEALDIRPGSRNVFQLELRPLDPRGDRLAFAPVLEGTAGVQGWEEFRGDWPKGGELFAAAGEDERRRFEFEVFRERVPRGTAESARPMAVEDALAGRKNNARIEDLLRRARECAVADPTDFFARYLVGHLLRRANRPAEAGRALDEMAVAFPLADGSQALMTERFHTLFALERFADATAIDLGIPALASMAQESARYFRDEAQFRAEEKNLPRLRFETPKGGVTVALFEDEAPNHVAHLLSLVASGRYAGAEFTTVVGGAFAQVTTEPLADRVLPDSCRRRVWRGTMAMVAEGAPAGVGAGFLWLTTRASDLDGRVAVVGRIVEGMEAVDALEAGDKIASAGVLGKRDHPYEVKRTPR